MPDLSLALHECWLNMYCNLSNKGIPFFFPFFSFPYSWTVHMKYLTGICSLFCSGQNKFTEMNHMHSSSSCLVQLTTGRTYEHNSRSQLIAFLCFHPSHNGLFFLVPREKTILVSPTDSGYLFLSGNSYF